MKSGAKRDPVPGAAGGLSKTPKCPDAADAGRGATGAPIAGGFLMEYPMKLDENWGYCYFSEPPYLSIYIYMLQYIINNMGIEYDRMGYFSRIQWDIYWEMIRDGEFTIVTYISEGVSWNINVNRKRDSPRMGIFCGIFFVGYC